MEAAEVFSRQSTHLCRSKKKELKDGAATSIWTGTFSLSSQSLLQDDKY